MKAYCINLPERPEKWREFRSQKLPFKVERLDGIKKTPGWEGCRDAHLEALKKVNGMTVIFEDDCLFLHPWGMVMKIMEQLPKNWDCLYLGATLNEPLERYSKNLYRLKKGWCSHAIIYKDATVPQFVLANEMRKIDVFYANVVQEKFNCFLTFPLVATQRPGYSDIVNHRTEYEVITDRYKKYVL
jgi:hypothetical protein